jgi:thymidylate synthase
MKVYDDISQAYLGTLKDIYEDPEYVCSPRGLKCREKTDYTFRVLTPIAYPIVTKDQERNKKIESYTYKEMELYNSGSNKVEDFAKASKFWKKLANPDGTINSAYGHLIWEKKSHGNPAYEYARGDMDVAKLPEMKTPWEWTKESLRKDRDTRQAFLRFSLPEHQWFGNYDQTCTMHANFLIRDDQLNLSVVMRSNDLVLGLVYDMPWFVSLMDRMIIELKDTYPNLRKGHYTHTVHSMHIYEKDSEMIERMLNGKHN